MYPILLPSQINNIEMELIMLWRNAISHRKLTWYQVAERLEGMGNVLWAMGDKEKYQDMTYLAAIARQRHIDYLTSSVQ